MSVNISILGSETDALNISNRHFVELMEFLGVYVGGDDGLVGSIRGGDLTVLHDAAANTLRSVRYRYTADELQIAPGIYSFDTLDPRYLATRLSELVALCEEAEELGTYLVYG